jgi:hypothetical protein
MTRQFNVEFRDAQGQWQFSDAARDEGIAVEAAKLISEQHRALARIVDALTGKVHSTVEVL